MKTKTQIPINESEFEVLYKEYWKIGLSLGIAAASILMLTYSYFFPTINHN